jgi:hypothetical protein
MAGSFDLGFPPHVPNLSAVGPAVLETQNVHDTLVSLALEPPLRELVAAREQYSQLSRKALAAPVKSLGQSTAHGEQLVGRALALPVESITGAQLAAAQYRLKPLPGPPPRLPSSPTKPPPPLPPQPPPTSPSCADTAGPILQAAFRTAFPDGKFVGGPAYFCWDNSTDPCSFQFIPYSPNAQCPPGYGGLFLGGMSCDAAAKYATSLISSGWHNTGPDPAHICAPTPPPTPPPVECGTADTPPCPPPPPPPPPTPPPTPPPAQSGCVRSADYGWSVDDCSDQDLAALAADAGIDVLSMFDGADMASWYIQQVGRQYGSTRARQVSNI